MLTSLTQMEKYKQGVFGKCPRVICESQHLLPMGQHDIPNTSHVKLYCAKCEDIYNPKSSRHNSIDGAYFGTSFHNILFQVRHKYPRHIHALTVCHIGIPSSTSAENTEALRATDLRLPSACFSGSHAVAGRAPGGDEGAVEGERD